MRHNRAWPVLSDELRARQTWRSRAIAQALAPGERSALMFAPSGDDEKLVATGETLLSLVSAA